MQINELSEFPSRVRALLSNHGVTDLGRDLVFKVRAGPPARAVEGAGGNVTGRYPSKKMQRTIQYESRTVEFAFVISCETDPDVIEYFDQPARLSLRYSGANGRDVVVGHVPDFLVLGESYAGFIECKDERQMAKLAEQYPTRYVADPDLGWRCPPGEDAAKPYGLGYRIWTPRDVPPALTDNARFLEAEWGGGSSRSFPDAVAGRIAEYVRGHPAVSLEELVTEFGDPDPVYWALYHRHVHVDLSAAFLAHPDRVRVFVDEDAAAAWRAASESLAEDTAHIASPETIINAALAQFPPDAIRVARERYEILRPAIESGVPAHRLTGRRRRTRAKWLLAYRRAQAEGGVGLVGLCPRYHRQGNRGTRLSEQTRASMEEIAETVYETAENRTGRYAYGRLVDLCRSREVPPPSYMTFMRYLKTRDEDRQLARRKGRKEAAAQAPAYGPRDPSVLGQGPLDVIYVDHTQCDVLMWMMYGTEWFVERPNLTLATCGWSSCAVGYDLSFDPPATSGLFMAIRDVLRRHKRRPNRVVVDRAGEFGSIAFEELAAAAEFDPVRRPPGKPKFGSPVERMFDTVNTQLIHNLAGNTQLLKNPRSMSREVDPSGRALWTLEEFDRVLRMFLFETYPSQPHRGLGGQTPRERFEAGLRTVGSGRVLSASALHELEFLLWPPARRGTATVNPRYGITVDWIRYWHPDMRSDGVRGTKVRVRVIPEDVTQVAAFILGRWVLCRSERSGDLEGYSRRELRIASKVWRLRNRHLSRKLSMRVDQAIPLLREIRETEEGLRQAARDAERRKALDCRGLRLVGDVEAADGEQGSGAAGDLWKGIGFGKLKRGRRL